MRPSFLSILMVPGIRNSLGRNSFWLRKRDLNRPQLEDGSQDRWSVHFGHVYQLCPGGHQTDWNLADLVVRNRG
jgi:hypothetical protein